MRVRLVTLVVVAGLVAASCASSPVAESGASESTSVVTTAANEPTRVAPTATTVAPTTTASTVVAVTSTRVPPTTVVSAPWAIEIADDTDYGSVDLAFGVEEVLRANGLIEATIVSISGWCCENPPFQVTDVEVLAGSFPDDRDGMINGVAHQELNETLKPGDRVTILLRGQIAEFVFTADEGLAHPVPAHQAAAIEALRVRLAAFIGFDPAEVSPLTAVTDLWNRYRDDWWGSIDQRVALALSGVPGYPTTCSAADLGPLLQELDNPQATVGLPEAVARTREAVIDAAVRCDYEQIIELSGYVPGTEDNPVDVDAFWWNAMRSLENFIEVDRNDGALRELVFAVTATPVGESIGTAYDPDAQEAREVTYYFWPSAYRLPTEEDADNGLSFVDLVDQDELNLLAALNRTTVDRLLEGVEAIGGYAWFRTAITADGQWWFALSGD